MRLTSPERAAKRARHIAKERWAHQRSRLGLDSELVEFVNPAVDRSLVVIQQGVRCEEYVEGWAARAREAFKGGAEAVRIWRSEKVPDRVHRHRNSKCENGCKHASKVVEGEQEVTYCMCCSCGRWAAARCSEKNMFARYSCPKGSFPVWEGLTKTGSKVPFWRLPTLVLRAFYYWALA